MTGTSNVLAGVEPEIKERVENGIPFERRLPVKRPLVMGELTKEKLDAEIARGVADIENGRVYSAEEVFEEMHRSYGI